jgi:signal transduction histidine kinase
VTLTTRLSVFSLAGLAVVLGGFSVALFLIARAGAYRELDQRVDGVLDAMNSVVEVKPNGVEWEPDIRGFTPSARQPVAWGVFGDSADLMAHSPGEQAMTFLLGFSGREDGGYLFDRADDQGGLWRVRLRRVNAPESYNSVKPILGAVPRTTGSRKQATVLLVAAAAYSDTEAYVRRVALTLAGTSCIVWLGAAFLARRFCRHALAPVLRMAEAARTLQTADLSCRLPAPPTADELADLAQSFNDLLGRVQEAYERQRAFTTEASHQFRTPLAGILAQADVVLRGSRDPDEYRRAVRLMRERAEDLRSMVEALLFLARADSDTAPPDPEAFELTRWVRSSLTRWVDRPGAEDIRLVAPELGAWVFAHPVFLTPVFDNLLDNAIKYRFTGTPVTVMVEPLAGGVAIRVADHGPGIPTADLPQVFDPFFRSSDAQLRGVPGLGLGLAVARRLAAAMGGVLSVESEPGQGTRFTLILPAASSEEE